MSWSSCVDEPRLMRCWRRRVAGSRVSVRFQYADMHAALAISGASHAARLCVTHNLPSGVSCRLMSRSYGTVLRPVMSNGSNSIGSLRPALPLSASFPTASSKSTLAAPGSAKTLNSATGDVFPGTSSAPPMIEMSPTRAKVVGSCNQAEARLVSGPMAAMRTVPGGLLAKCSRMTSLDAFEDSLRG